VAGWLLLEDVFEKHPGDLSHVPDLRGIAGAGDEVARAIGFSRGLSGMTTAQGMGTAHPSAWMSFAGAATEVLFVAGGLMFGLAALRYQRAFPRRRSAENPAR
jgi:hypothetical protein